MMHPLEAYVHELQLLHASGAATVETSYYPALKVLLDAVGKTLQPVVRCITNPASAGAGIPDLGLYTVDQLQRTGAGTPRTAVLPARGVMEVKGTGVDVLHIAGSEQVHKYLERYRQVLATNYRDFQLVGLDDLGRPALLERYQLATDEAAFWAAAAHPQQLAATHREPFSDYLRRVLLRAAPLATPRDVASVLASYARMALGRVEQHDLPALAAVRGAFEQALGITFQGEKGDHFFRSTLVQTLFYGVFSAWVLWCGEQGMGASGRFEWRMAGWTLQVPVISFLFGEVAKPQTLRPLGLVEVLDWTGDALNRVDRASFFARFEERHAVQYFYEPFLEEFDPELRRELGVWYTPSEIVQYMVTRVDTVLRDQLGIAAGLADPRVYILDPCCGTGTYLVEVIRHIGARLLEAGADDLTALDIKRAAIQRVFGFELLPAPYVVAHLQIGLLLQSLGAPLSEQGSERAAVFLTNALTGWQPPQGAKQMIQFPELAAERDAAEHVKRETPILVILGNPPYNGFAGLAVGEERDLTEAYRTARTTRQPQGQGLNDLYVRFFRMAERRIAERTGEGVVCFISNYSWLDGLSFTAMRERLVDVFDEIWIDNLHGDRIISERSPDGRTSETVFATGSEAPGIKIGTAISLLAKRAGERSHCVIRYQDHQEAKAADRRATLLESSAAAGLANRYATLVPSTALGLPFKPAAVIADYHDWPLLPELFPVSYPGVKTSRDDVVVDIDRERLIERMRAYFDPAISHERMREILPGAMEERARFKAEAVRDHLRKRGFLADKIVPYYYRPFDVRWLYWEPETDLLDRKREDYFPQVFEGNWFLISQQKPRREWSPPQVSSILACIDVMDRSASCIPLYLRPRRQTSLFEIVEQPSITPNLSPAASQYLASVGAAPPDFFYHVLAMLHAPAYRAENAGALRQDWPRVPLPADAGTLAASAALGRQLCGLFDVQTTVTGITGMPMRAELGVIGVIRRVSDKPFDADHELRVTAGWGFAGQGGVTMAGKGRVVPRAYSAAEQDALRTGATGLGLTLNDVYALLGSETLDIWLNDMAYWSNVPRKVWEYTIGGYQALKKWLSYREYALLGRPLTVVEARDVGGIGRRIAAILLLGPALDARYAAVKADLFDWATTQQPTETTAESLSG